MACHLQHLEHLQMDLSLIAIMTQRRRDRVASVSVSVVVGAVVGVVVVVGVGDALIVGSIGIGIFLRSPIKNRIESRSQMENKSVAILRRTRGRSLLTFDSWKRKH